MQQDRFEVRSLWNGAYILLSIINILINIGFSMVTTTIAVYTASLGASLAIAGTVASVFSFAALLIRPISGLFVDRYHKEKLFVISTFLFGAVVYGYAFVKSIPMLFVLRILHGVLFSVSSTCNVALASRFIPKKRVGEGMGYFNAGMMAGQAVGPVIGVSIQGALGFSWLYTIVATSICLPPLLCLLVKMPEEIVKPAQGIRGKGKFQMSFGDMIAKQFVLYALVCGVFSFYNGIANSFMLLIGEARQISDISLFFTVSSAVLLAVRILIGRVSDRKSLTMLVNLSLAFTAISMFCSATAASLLLILAAAVMKALGQGIGYVSLQSEALKQADAQHVGVATSTMYIGNDLGNTLGPIVGGVVSQWAGYPMMFGVSIGLVALACFAFNLHQKRTGYRKMAVE